MKKINFKVLCFALLAVSISVLVAGLGGNLLLGDTTITSEKHDCSCHSHSNILAQSNYNKTEKSAQEVCYMCNGKGYVKCGSCTDGYSSWTSKTICSKCNGTNRRQCGTCYGTGKY